MDQKPYFRLETRSGIPWFEVESNLANDVVEVPRKRKLDPVAAHGSHVGSLATGRSAPRLWSLCLWLRRDLGFRRSTHLWRWRNFPLRRRHTRWRLRRGLGRRQRHFLDG